MPKKTENPIVAAAMEAADVALKKRKQNAYMDPMGALRAAVNAAGRAAAAKATVGMIRLADVESYLRDRDQLLEPEEVDGLMRAMYYHVNADLPEHLQPQDVE